MDRVTVPTTASADVGTTARTAAAWVRVSGWRGQAREKPCRNYVDELFPESDVVDLREHGLVTGVGWLAGGARKGRDAVR
jgi:hypothetical protein